VCKGVEVARRRSAGHGSLRALYVSALVHWLVLCTAAAAHAQATPTLELRGMAQAKAGCLSERQLLARVASYSQHGAPRPGLHMVLDFVSQDVAELRLYLLDVVVSKRRFEQLPTPCADRRDAIALSIALALEDTAPPPSAALPNTGPAAEPAATASSTLYPASAPSERSVNTAQTAANREQEPVLAAQRNQAIAQAPRVGETAGADAHNQATQPSPAPTTPVLLGSMPSATTHQLHGGERAGLQLHVGGRWLTQALPVPVWALAAGIVVSVSRVVSIDVGALTSTVGQTRLSGGRARAQLLAGLEALGCGAIPVFGLGLQACSGAALAMIEANGADYVVRRGVTLVWAAGLARLMLRWPREGWLSVRLVAQGHVNMTRARLLVDGSTARLEPWPVGASVGLELLLALP
jgi:hypothetical protein